MKNRRDIPHQVDAVVTQLIYSFISEKVKQYKEPQRKGTPRGNLIGLSKVKYHAALLCMTELRLIDISGLLNVSPGVMRLWHIEPAFKECTEKHLEEFCNRLNISV